MTIIAIALTVLLGSGSPALCQEVALQPDSEAGFRRLMAMSQGGELGSDVSNANIGIRKDGSVAIELVRRGQPNLRFVLQPRRGGESPSRYFDIRGESEEAADRTGALAEALDRCFSGNPFTVAVIEQPPGATMPGWLDAWRADGLAGLARAAELRMTALRSLGYTIGLTALLAALSFASVLQLWFSDPRRSDSPPARIR